MKNESLAANQAVASGIGSTESNVSDLTTWLFDLAAILLLLTSIAVGLESWSDAFSTPDQRLFSSCVLTGMLIAVARSKWRGELTWTNVRCARIACVLGSVLVCLSALLSQPVLGAIASGVFVAAWGMGRLRGDTVFQGVFLGLTLLSPLALEALASLGFFGQLQPITIGLTSLLADAIGAPHAREANGLLFAKGTADQFYCFGVWDSVAALSGVSLFCALVFRRNLLTGLMNLFLCFFIWAAVRSFAWVMIVLLASPNSRQFAWSFELEVILFVFGAMLVLSLDRIFSEVFRPIPFENFDTETPLGSFSWNWLCGLPKLSLRIPKRNKISQRWRTLLHIAGRKPTFWTDFEWFRIEIYHLLRHPITVIGSMIDVVRGWKDTRKWVLLLSHLPSLLFLSMIYFTIAFYSTKRSNSQVQFLADESQKLCPTESLETACEWQQEPEFCKAIRVPERKEILPTSISESIRREVEIQSKRILEAFPTNSVAKYRLGLIYALNGETERAVIAMNDVVKERPGATPQADAWLAKTMIINSAAGIEIQSNKLMSHLENLNARKGNKVDSRLLLYYALALEDRKEGMKSAYVAKQAADANPELILELAKLRGRLGDKEGKEKTAEEAIDYYFKAINSETERESDRLALADAMLIANKVDEAIKVLQEGLKKKPEADAIRRKLCNTQIDIYKKSIQRNSEGKYDLDMSLLEAAADTNPNEPNLSSEISKLLPFGKRPTPKLMDVIKNQVDKRLVSVPSLLLLGEAFYERSNLEAAKRYWEAALEKDPDNYRALNNLATCLIELSPTHANRAIEMVVKANSLAPSNPDILDTWGDTLVASNRPKEAVGKYEMAVKIDGNRTVTRKKLIEAYQAAGMLDDAKFQAKALEEVMKAKGKAKE